MALVWTLWPASLGNVTNLGSRGTNIIAFGDSLTAGNGAGADEAYPVRLASRLGVPVINAGVSGDTTTAALARLDADVLDHDPRIVIVGLGGNDFLRREAAEATEANLRTIVRSIQGAGAMVILLGFEFPSLNADYAAMYERIAEEEGCVLVPGVIDGVLTDSSLRSDPFHPNARGYEVMAERVAGRLEKLVEKADAAR